MPSVEKHDGFSVTSVRRIAVFCGISGFSFVANLRLCSFLATRISESISMMINLAKKMCADHDLMTGRERVSRVEALESCLTRWAIQ